MVIYSLPIYRGSSFDYAMRHCERSSSSVYTWIICKTGFHFLFLLYLSATMYFGAWELIDALEIIGISLFILLFGRPKWGFKDIALFENIASRYQSLAIPLLRIFTGANLLFWDFQKTVQARPGDNFCILTIGILCKCWALGIIPIIGSCFPPALLNRFRLLLILGLLTRLTVFSLAIFLSPL